MTTPARAVMCILALAACAISACESTQQETISPTASGKSTQRPASGANQPSKPISKSASTTGARPTATPKDSKPPASSADTNQPPKKFEPSKSAQQPKPGVKTAAGLPPPTYAEIASAYNSRTARLQRVWGRAVVSVDFTDEDGKRRWEQGEGHFQVVQPSKMALSAGKLGEVMLWIGCDASRYWFIDAKESRRAWVGKHASATRRKIESLGMPAAPRDLLALTGVTPLPSPSAGRRADPVVRWTENRKSLVFELDRDGARWRYHLNPKTYEPSRIEVIDTENDEPILTATLDVYANVTIRGEGTVPPRMASRMRCLHHASGSTLGLSIADMADGGTGRLREPNFDFNALRELLGIRDVVDLDAPRPAAARANTDADQE